MTGLDAHTLGVFHKHHGHPLLKEIYGEAPNAVRAARQGFEKQIRVAHEKLASGGPFVLGDTFSGADILLTTCLIRAGRYELRLTEALRDYMRRTTSREAYRLGSTANHRSGQVLRLY